MKPKIIIIGAGGHGKVVYDAILAQDKYQVLGFIDAQLPIGTKIIGQVEMICQQEHVASLANQAAYFVVAIGNNKIRAQVYENLIAWFKPAIIIHPSSVIGSDVTIGEGTVVLSNSTINAFSKIGQNSIINSGAIVDHEAIIGNHVYLKIGSIVGNNAKVADYFMSDLGEIIKPFSN